MKLPNSYGSVYKLSGNRRKPWRAIVTTGWTLDPETGKSKQVRKTVGYYATRQEALTALASYNQDPFDLSVADTTFGECYERWSSEHFHNLGESAIRTYKAAYKICEPLKNRRMVDIKLDDLQYVADHSGKNEPTLQKYKNLCNAIFEYAALHDIISADRNKTKYINIKKAGNPNALSRQPFTAKEIEKLWQWENKNNHISVILMLIYSGARVNELLNLKKENVNLAERWFDVTASKTKSGIRKVPIADKVFSFYEYWYNLNDSEYLLTTPSGTHFIYSNYAGKYWTPLLDEMGMKHLPHDARHTCITMLAEAGVDDRVIRKIVGHTGVGIAEVTYTHFEIEKLLEAINKI